MRFRGLCLRAARLGFLREQRQISIKNIVLQIRGLIRFSYPADGGFNLSVEHPVDVAKVLYQQERLTRRLAFFEKLALHSLAIQDEDKFRVGILIGDDLPAWCRARLEEMISEFPQAQIIAMQRKPHYQALCAAYAALPNDPGATHVARFRLDDDDALHRTATRHMRDKGLAMLAGGFEQPFALAFHRGLYLDLNSPEPQLSDWVERTSPSPGLTVVAPLTERTNCYRYNHRRLSQHMNCYSEMSQPMFLRAVHDSNDSGANPTGIKGALKPNGIARVLRRGFIMGPDHFEGL